MPPVYRRAFVGSLPLIAAMARRATPEPASPPLPFIELDHVSLRVADVRRSARFYMRLFGTDAARDLNRQANPSAQPAELWFIRLGRSHLALAPRTSGDGPGVDHYCLSVAGFAKEAAKAHLAAFVQPFPDWPSNNIWLADPDGLLIQLAPSANEPQLATIVRNAVRVDRPSDLPTNPPFRPDRIARLTLTTPDAAASASYYRRLIGNERPSGRAYVFPVGPSTLVVEQRGAPSFRVAVTPFDAASASATLASFGIRADIIANGSAVVFRDPDEMIVEIAAS